MKKSNIRTFLFAILTLLSISSYIYLTIISTNDTTINTSTTVIEEEIDENIYLPDVALIQHIFKTGKQIVDTAL